MQDIVSERVDFRNRGYWSVRKDGQTENCVAAAGCVAAFLQSSSQNSTLRCGFMIYNCVQIALFMAVFVSVFVE